MSIKKRLKDELAIHTVIPRYDIDLILFLGSSVFTILIGVLFTKAAFGSIYIPILVIFAYLSLVGTHGLHTISLYFYKLAFLNHEETREIRITVWRYGEIVGFILLNYIALFNPLYMLGITKVFPAESVYLFDGLTSILAGTSLWKMWIGQQPRVHYNKLFKWTTLITTVSVLLSITIGALNGKTVPPEMSWMLFGIFVAYTYHDRLLEITCLEKCDDQVSDYLISGIVIAWGLVMVVLFMFGVNISQVDFVQLFIGIPAITVISVIIKDRKIDDLEKRKEKRTERLEEVQEKLAEATEEIKENIEEQEKEDKENGNHDNDS